MSSYIVAADGWVSHVSGRRSGLRSDLMRVDQMATHEPIHQISAVRTSGGPVAARVVEQIQDYIEGNGLQPGHKLPPERVFIEQLGVSRSSLREAVRVLSTLGLIDVRHGDGMYVAAPPEMWRASSSAIFDATEEHALRNLVETRLGIELAAVTAAAQRATDEDLDRLQQLVDEQARRVASDPHY